VLRRERLYAVKREQELEIHRLLGHRVPSLSKAAMRSSSGVKSGEPRFVTRSTKSRMAFFDAVLFHDRRGSLAALRAVAGTGRNIDKAGAKPARKAARGG